MDRKTPRVIWQGRRPKPSTEVFRLVDRGAPREVRPNERQFIVESSRGRDAMGAPAWTTQVNEHNKDACIQTLAEVLGRVINMDPAELHRGHTISCELNMAVIEGREARGCDCEAGV